MVSSALSPTKAKTPEESTQRGGGCKGVEESPSSARFTSFSIAGCRPRDSSSDQSLPYAHLCSGRCVCLHAWAQWTDLALQALLLHHGLLTIPIHSPLAIETEKRAAERVRAALAAVLKGRRHSDVEEVALCLGASPARLSHIYRMPVAICGVGGSAAGPAIIDEEERKDSAPTRCGSPCSALNAVEQRRINRALFQRFPPEAKSAAAQRLFIFVRAAEEMLSEDLLEYEMSSAKEELILTWNHSSCPTKESRGKEESILMRLKSFI